MKCILESLEVQEVLRIYVPCFDICDTTKHVLDPQMKLFSFLMNFIPAINAIIQTGEIAIIIFAFPRLMTVFQ